MDDPTLDPDEHARALRGLAQINLLSRTAVPIIREVRRLAAALDRAVGIVDVAAGGGDVALHIARRAAVPTELTLVDISPRALEVAEGNAARHKVTIHTVVSDLFETDVPVGDLIMCTLFLHHLDEKHAVAALRRMRDSAKQMVLVSDLRRCACGRALAGVVPRLITSSHVVRTDAVRSARAAWSRCELIHLADRAGMGEATIRRLYPARMLLRWSRTS